MLLEKPKVNKDTTLLIDDLYNNPNTSLLIFRFEPHSYLTTISRLEKCQIAHTSIEKKDLYVIDDFFLKTEVIEMQEFSKMATFSRKSYGSSEAIAKGEKGALSMNGKERWQFFSHPPTPINEVYKLFGMFAHRLEIDLTTLPWELCDEFSHASPAVIANKLEEASKESMELGKHQDCNPEKQISFGIPILYAEGKEFHPSSFGNGERGRPWLVSVMVYCPAENFLPEYSMGTVFYQKDGKIATRVDCLNMRIVLFEGDIFHSIEESNIPEDCKTWRISYVYKLIMNPRKKGQNIKQDFFEMINNLNNTYTSSH